MKKLAAFALALVCASGMMGCGQRTVNGSEVYSFPEPTTLITGRFYSQGMQTAFEIGADDGDISVNSVIEWFYGLKLTACAAPEQVEGSQAYSFDVDGREDAFTYEDRGNVAYIIIDGSYYKVGNPSVPPIK